MARPMLLDLSPDAESRSHGDQRRHRHRRHHQHLSTRVELHRTVHTQVKLTATKHRVCTVKKRTCGGENE